MIIYPANYGTIVLFPGDQLELLIHRSGIPLMPSWWSVQRDGVNVTASSSYVADVSAPGSYTGGCNADPGESFSFAVVAGATAPTVLRAKMNVRLPGVPFVQGYMRYDLAQQQLIPCNEPYTAMGFTPSSAGSEVVDGCEALFVAKQVVDWVHVELRAAANPSTVIAARNALLRRDGTVTDTDGESPLAFEAMPGDYRIAVMHRNHLGVVTDQAFALRGAPPMISFTGGILISMGAFLPAPTCGGQACAFTPGNTSHASAQQCVAYVGANNDRDPILVRVGGGVPTNVASGYFLEDINMDGVVRYVGANNDRDLILQAIGGSVPTNVIVGQTP